MGGILVEVAPAVGEAWETPPGVGPPLVPWLVERQAARIQIRDYGFSLGPYDIRLLSGDQATCDRLGDLVLILPPPPGQVGRYLDVEELVEVVEADGRADERVLEVHIPQEELLEARRPEEQDAVPEPGVTMRRASVYQVSSLSIQVGSRILRLAPSGREGLIQRTPAAAYRSSRSGASSTTVYGLPDQTWPRDISRSSMWSPGCQCCVIGLWAGYQNLASIDAAMDTS